MKGKGVCRGLILICFSFLFFLTANAQDFKSEAELKKKAEELFDQGEYVAANPLFSQLLSLYPKDPNYNFKFGVCLLYTTENKEKPLTYLEYASKKPETEKEVFFFLGRAYHLNYRFSDAVVAYENFKKNGNPKTVKKYEVEQHILMCRNGISLLKNVKDLYVLEKKSMKEEDFFRAYNTEGLKGKLIVKPDEFKSPVDKKKKESSVMFIAQGSEELYISSYGQDDKNGKDIFRCKKLPSGEWGPLENLGSSINTSFDEDYPFLHADGKTLYFSSKGHNSMGGYDVFKSVYDSATSKWSAPVNLDFAVSTPDDDIFFMPDSGKTYAYFASKRNSPAGRVDVYKLKVDMIPVEIAIIKGKLASEVGGQSLEATITVKKAEGGETIGEFKTNPKTGEYFVSVPNGGRFTFEVESPDFSRKSETVVIPTQYELRALKQGIALKPSKLVITNFFDEIMSDEDTKAATMAFLKEKAKLEVNYSDTKTQVAATEVKTTSEEIPNSTNVTSNNSNTSSQQSKTETKPVAKFSNQELVDIAKEDAADARKDAEELQDKSDNASFAAKKKEEEAQGKLNAATEMEASANSIADPVKKEEEIQKANLLKKEGELLNKEAAAISTLAQTLYKESQQKFKEAKENEKYAQDLEQAVKSNSKESILKLTEQRTQLEASASEEKEKDFGLQQIKAEAAAKQEEADKAEKALDVLKNELAEAETEQKNIRDQADKTKNKKEKQALIQQADLLTPDIEEKRKEVETQSLKAEELASEAATANNQLEIFSKVLSGSTLAEITDATSANKSSTQSGSPVSSASTAETAVNNVNQAYQAQVNEASSKPEGSEKQKVLAQVYDKWASDLQAEAEKRKASLKKITDPQKRSDEADAILALETAASEKMALASDARANADELASSNTSAKSNSAETKNVAETNKNVTAQEQNTNTSGNNAANTSQSSAITAADVTASKEKVEQINNTYTNDLAVTDKIGSEIEKEQAKVAILDSWVKALAEQSADLKTKISAASDPEVKKALESELAVVEQMQVEKQNQASVAFSRAERAKRQNTDVNQVINLPAGKDAQYSAAYSKQLANTDTIKDLAARETEKAKIYQKWTEDIRSEKAELEAFLPKVADEAAKNKLTEKISNLDTFLNQQNELALSSKKAAEEALATSTSGSQTAGNNQVAASSATVSSSTVQELNRNYENSLASVDTIQDPERKKQEQARVLNEWSDKLTASATTIRIQAASLTDDEVKNFEIARADQLDTEAKQKKEQAQYLMPAASVQISSVSSSETAKNDQSSDAASNSTNQTSNDQNTAAVTKAEKPQPVPVERYQQELSSVDTRVQGDELAKVEEKRKIYDSWARDIEKQITYLKGEKESVTDPAEKAALDSKIAELERESLEKQSQASLQVAKADRLRKEKQQQTLAAENNTTEASEVQATNSTTSSSGLNTQPETAKTPEVSKDVISKLNGSARLKFQADSLRQAIASVPDQTRRSEMLAQSVLLEKESMKQRAEASSAMSTQNSSEYRKNASVISEYAAVSSRNQSDEVTMANMLATESEYYQKEAKTIRGAVTTNEPTVSTITALERAEEYEKLSVEKQQKAIALYSKANQGYVVKAGGSEQQPVAAVNQGDQNTVNANRTANPVVQEQSTAQKNNTTDPQETNSQVAIDTNSQSGNPAETVNQQNTSEANNNRTAQQSDTTVSQVVSKKFATRSDSLNALKITSEADRLEKIAATEQSSVENYRKASEAEKSIADSLTTEAAKPEKSSEKASLEQEAARHSTLSRTYKERADSVSSLAANSKAAAEAKRKEAELLAIANKPADQSSAQPVTSTNNVENNSASRTASESKDIAIPEDYLTETNELKREIFIAYANRSAYSASKPIPINDKIPNGIIFKVQVGAFRNPIAPEVLKGFAPLMGETSPTGITRYTAGFFKIFENANAARKEINGMGYRDAFVVAFCNGKRISVSEAQRLVREGKDCSGSVVASNAGTQPAVNAIENTQQENQSAIVNTNARTTNETAATQNVAPENVPVQQVKGLFYTVQVGVYSSKVPAGKLNFLQPLYSEPTETGLIRYSVGMYNNIEIAKAAKKVAVDFGISDAFVTAYVNGKRIPVSEAQKLEAENGKSVFASDEKMNRMPEVGTGNAGTRGSEAPAVPQRNEPGVIITNTPGTTSSVETTPAFAKTVRAAVIPMSDTGLVFRVQIGAFKDEVPVDIAAKFIKIADKGVNHYMADSLTIYTVGGYRDYETAEKLKQSIAGEGLTDAFVVAYRRGEKMPLEEAIKQATVKY